MTGNGGLSTALRGDENPKPANSETESEKGEGEKLENDCIVCIQVLHMPSASLQNK